MNYLASDALNLKLIVLKVSKMKIAQIVGLDKSIFALTEDGELWEFNTQLKFWSKCRRILNRDQVLEEKRKLLIDNLGVSNRVLNALKKHDVDTIGDLLDLDESDVMSIIGLGDKSMFELKNAISLLKESI